MELFEDFEIESVRPQYSQEVQGFLKRNGLGYDDDIEYTIALKLKEEIIATGSFAGNVLKCIAVADEYKGCGLSSKIISELITKEYCLGRSHLFIYTKPKNIMLFRDLGFYEIERVEDEALLMENKPDGIRNYTNELKLMNRPGKIIGSIVMNCNPFTLGHKYIIEYAASKSDILHIFIVWEDKSVFPNDVRYMLAKEETNHLNNVVIHKATNYIISNATFPSYFIKAGGDLVRLHAKMDLNIFAHHIAPSLGINKRFVGEEPLCATTKVYNDEMRKILPKVNIEVEQIKRYEINSQAVSASKVRTHIKNGDFDKIEALVPSATYDFIMSPEGDEIIRKIKSSQSRH